MSDNMVSEVGASLRQELLNKAIEFLNDGRVAVNPKYFDIIAQQPFDRTYLDRYNSLNCKPDIELVCRRLSAKQVTNVMAAWTCYKKQYGIYKEHVNDETFVVYAPNKRMATFLRHMTKWQVHDKAIPAEEFTYFGINPDRKELQDLARSNMIRSIIVGATQSFLESCYNGTLYSFQDQRILGPNKTVSW